MTVLGDGSPPAGQARERILAAAYNLFAHRGIRAVGIDTIVAESGVARQTLYRHFASKQDLVLTFLQRRDQVWTKDWLQAEVERRGSTPHDRLLAIFDVFDDWFREPGYEGCAFINVMLEHPDRSHPLHRAAASYLTAIQHFLEDLARQAGIASAEGLARDWHLLMKGAIVAACEGDTEAALSAKRTATMLLERATETPRRRRSRSRPVTPRQAA